MKRQAKGILILLSFAASLANAQSPAQDQSAAQETQARGYWVDPAIGLTWTAKDNGKDVSRNQAASYCKNLKTASYSDWRLASIEELLSIHEKGAKSPGEYHLFHNHETKAATYDVKGGIFLTGRTWSTTDVKDDRGFRPEFGWFLDFNDQGRLYDKLGLYDGMRALCVRGSAHGQPIEAGISSLGVAEQTLARGFWIDPATGLMWAAKDNFEDVSWHKAVKYCRDLRLAGHTDWRLPEIGELGNLHIRDLESPGENPRSRWHGAESMTWYVKGNLFLAGKEWSGSRIKDDRGKPGDGVWYADFHDGSIAQSHVDTAPIDFIEGYSMHALCVRHPLADETK